MREGSLDNTIALRTKPKALCLPTFIPYKIWGEDNADGKSVGIVPPLLTPVATLDSGGDPREDLVGDGVADLGHTL